MTEYPVKIWIAFAEAVGGNKDFNTWLLKNGFPELSALDHSIKVSDKAFDWLVKNGFPHFAAFSRAIYEEKQPYEWLKKHNFSLLVRLTDAINYKQEELERLKKEIPLFYMVALKIQVVRDSRLRDIQDYHKFKL